MEKQGKHENYAILNLIGYGLAKFDMRFVRLFGYTAKSTFYNFIVQCGIADTVGTVKNRQDLFDPFFDNGRRGWWQKGDTYLHRKASIDTFFGSLEVKDYADIVKMYLHEEHSVPDASRKEISPVTKSQFKQLQETGYSAELFFKKNYQKIPSFTQGVLYDARMLGDGYDFQISVQNRFFLAEIKGMQGHTGSIRMTKNEFNKAQEYGGDYTLVVVANLYSIPEMQSIFDPTKKLKFIEKSIASRQLYYHANFALSA